MALGEKSFFWDKPAGDLTEDELEYYEYAAQDLASVYETMYTTGVCPAMAVSGPDDNPEDYIGSSLACTAGDGLNVVISPGAAMIKGRIYLATLPVILSVAAGAVTDILLRMDLQSEKPTITLHAKQRASGTSLEQNISHESLIYEIAVATVDVPIGSIQTDLSMITDQRLNTTEHPTDGKPVSGLMRSIPFVETKGIWEQWTVLKEQIENIISDVVSGVIPDMSITTPKFAPDAKAPFSGKADNGVFPLTHSKSGTTHALTGLSGVSGTVSCVFTATAAYSAGDTITVDGTAYAIQLSNGEAAEDNLFVSGASVPVVIDTAGKKVNFKAAGVSMPDGTTAIYKVYTENGTFTAPITGKYRFTAIGVGGIGSGDGQQFLNGNWTYCQSAGGASGGVAQITLSLQRGANYSVTVDSAQTSLGSLITATAGAQGNWGSSGVGGTATGGDVNFPGMSGNVNEQSSQLVPLGHAHGGAHDNAVDTIPFLSTQADNQNGASKPSSSIKPNKGYTIAPDYKKPMTPYGCGGGGGCADGRDGTYIEGGNGVTGALIVEMVIN